MGEVKKEDELAVAILRKVFDAQIDSYITPLTHLPEPSQEQRHSIWR
jgi:hypothetical protein